MEIRKGTEFETPFEIGCIALEEPDSDGFFLALDYEKVECSFHIQMVIGHPAYKEPSFKPEKRIGEIK